VGDRLKFKVSLSNDNNDTVFSRTFFICTVNNDESDQVANSLSKIVNKVYNKIKPVVKSRYRVDV
jgi:methionyl-tRNA synthetase